MKKVQLSLFALLVVAFAVASAFTLAPVKKDSKDASTIYKVHRVVGFSGDIENPEEVAEAALETRIAESSTPQTPAQLSTFCQSGAPICLAIVKYQDDVPVEVNTVKTGLFVNP